MGLRKNAYPLRSTERGQIGWVTGLWFLMFLWVLLCACLQMELFRASSRYMEDALAASNLAAAVIDVEEYGISHSIRIDSPEEAYLRYQWALKGNLGLNAKWECENREMISGPVSIEKFIVYNVIGGYVEAYSYDKSGPVSCWSGSLGQETAPNGIQIEHTGIYSEISYQIKGLFGIEVTARKGKLVDVAENR